MVMVHEKKPLPLVSSVLAVVAFFDLDRLCNLCRNNLLAVHLMDNVYVRQDRICIRGFQPSI